MNPSRSVGYKYVKRYIKVVVIALLLGFVNLIIMAIEYNDRKVIR